MPLQFCFCSFANRQQKDNEETSEEDKEENADDT